MNYDDDEYFRRKRRKYPFDSIGEDEFEKIFAQMQEEIQRLMESDKLKDYMEEMLKNFGEGSFNKRFVRGISFKIGPDGKPRIQEFGNRPIKSAKGQPTISDEREPITDIIESDEDVAVTVEIPGVEKNDIDLKVTNDTLKIKVDKTQRKYHKTLDLPCDVIPNTTKATYKNGILDIVIKRKEKRKPGKGFHVNIE
jgi:HSP20 family protein